MALPSKPSSFLKESQVVVLPSICECNRKSNQGELNLPKKFLAINFNVRGIFSLAFGGLRSIMRRRRGTMKHFYSSLVLACLLASALWAADDPFVGKWKLNMEKSKFTGEQTKIEDLGGSKYKWTTGNVTNTYIADGTDQPTHFGNTVAITPVDANNWKMVIKKDGRILSSMTHTLSADGKTQTIKGTSNKPDGTTDDFTVVMKKVSGGSGWGGTWEDTVVKFTSPDEWEIQSYEGDGLSFFAPAYKDTLSMKFDGKDYEEKGPNVAPGSMSSGKRVNAHTLEVTDKVKGEIMDHTRFEVSPDGKTLTLTVHGTGQPNAQTFVYNKT
jgi:hypothetical protein